MLLKDRAWETCKCCGTRTGLVSKEEYVCDFCKSVIGENHLETKVFHQPGLNEVETLQFCSWECALRKIRTLKTDYFINLPYLSFDNSKDKGQTARDFWKAVAAVGTELSAKTKGKSK